MGSPTLTVSVLVVLWLIVIVPMIFRRKDERAQERSVQRFGRAMRSLTRRSALASNRPLARAVDPEDATYVRTRTSADHDEVFVTGSTPTRPRAQSARRLTPGEEVEYVPEAQMYPVDRSEMSAARQHMMARRRRSLLILGGGSVVMLLLALVVGGGLFWTAAMLFVVGFAGYLWFLRSQALRDRERRENRQERSVARRTNTEEISAREHFFAEPPASVVRIDDDDIELHNLDTVDLTGLYNEESSTAAASVQRRAS
jgi:hypothetical protein